MDVERGALTRVVLVVSVRVDVLPRDLGQPQQEGHTRDGSSGLAHGGKKCTVAGCKPSIDWQAGDWLVAGWQAGSRIAGRASAKPSVVSFALTLEPTPGSILLQGSV
jgi:hypothetical protein